MKIFKFSKGILITKWIYVNFLANIAWNFFLRRHVISKARFLCCKAILKFPPESSFKHRRPFKWRLSLWQNAEGLPESLYRFRLNFNWKLLVSHRSHGLYSRPFSIFLQIDKAMFPTFHNAPSNPRELGI